MKQTLFYGSNGIRFTEILLCWDLMNKIVLTLKVKEKGPFNMESWKSYYLNYLVQSQNLSLHVLSGSKH